ncbi:MAG TPA: GAF and ANTAR domain-containing protein [Actinomycetota bacterium]|jgi:GAF domain-containing protein|nr:GAF and ANTAR domain-containing protein [Actinomycetota bacterium]
MTTSGAELQQALDQLADLRQGPVTLEEALERVVATADPLFGVDGTALMLVDRDQVLRNLAASDKLAEPLEELQATHGEGPCVDAFDDKEPVAASDLVDGGQWPSFSPAAVDHGLRAVLASPIPYSDQAVGVVAVFDSRPHPWTDAESEAIVAFTDLVALLILNAMEASERGRLASELQVALDSRVVIEQAKGVLVGRHGLTTRQAFERLRRQARDQRRPLTEVARAVVSAAEHR